MAESFTTRLIQRLQIEQKKNDHGGVYAFAQRTLAYHSNRIEGSTLTEKQTASLFDTGTLTSEDALIRAKDVEEMTGHFLMFNEMLKTYAEPLSNELIKRYHYKLKSGVFEDIANGYPIGEYKNRRNIVSDITTALPEDVHARMTTLLDEYNAADKHDLHGLAKFHADYEAIFRPAAESLRPAGGIRSAPRGRTAPAGCNPVLSARYSTHDSILLCGCHLPQRDQCRFSSIP